MAYCRDVYGRTYYCRSTWNSWARWLVLGVIIAAFLLFFFLCSCVTARRRRKAGRKPFYGTGWAAAGPNYNSNNNTAQPQYQQQQYGQTPAAPAYNSGYNSGGYSGGQNNSYYSGQPTEMQAPQNAYRGDGYAPPTGPPPGKH